jgi:hypothetical protein
MITTLKIAGKEDSHIAHIGFALGAFFKAPPFNAEVDLMLESFEALLAMNQCLESEAQGFKPETFTSMPAWQEILLIRKAKVIGGAFRKMVDEEDLEATHMRQTAIRQAEEMMQLVARA